MKSISAEQNGSHEPKSDNVDVSKKDGEQDKTVVNDEVTKPEVPGDVKETSDNVENAVKGEEADKAVAETEDQESENAQKSSDSPIEKENQRSGEEKTNAAAYKNNKDVVLREDLKSIFQKFGTVKVFPCFLLGSISMAD